MPGNKKPRKKYRPKALPVGAVLNPVHYVAESVRPPAPALVDKLRMQQLGAIEAFVTGRGDMQQWSVLAQMTNISQHLGEAGCGPEAVPIAEVAAAGLMNALARFERGEGFGFDGQTIQALREVRAYMDLQFQSLTVAELEKHFADLRREHDELARKYGMTTA